MMDQLIAGFAQQLKDAFAIGEKADIKQPDRDIQNIVVSGLGGSGIGAHLVSEWVAQELPVPIVVNRDYHLPHFVDSHSLVIISSYSGNTEETVSAMKQAIEKKAFIVAITSGGQVHEMAVAHQCNLIQIPGGNPPRSALGLSIVQQLFALYKLGLITAEVLSHLDDAIERIEQEEDSIRSDAKDLADYFMGKVPVLYSASTYGSVAVRFRQQINENAKMLCWHHVLPEMNHNELVGWKDRYDTMAVLFLRHQTDYARTQQRIELTKQIIQDHTHHVRELWSKGDSAIERCIYLIHLTDWTTYYLAQMREEDAMEVQVIDYLKEELGKR